MKKKLLSLFTIILSACAIGFISTIGLFNTSAKAEEPQVAFEMLGASLRLGMDYDTDGDTTGLRFAAQVDKAVAQDVLNDANKTFGGVIVPASLLTADEETGRPAFKSSENIFTYMETYHPGVTLAYKEDLTIGERTNYNVVALSLTNVANKNLARDFYGVIYIKNGTEYEFAASGVTKSVHYVSTATVADTESYLTEEQAAAATVVAKKAAHVARVGAANVSNSEDLNTKAGVLDVELSSNYVIEANEWNNTTLEYAYAATGKVDYNVIIDNEDQIKFNAYREYSVAPADKKFITVDRLTGEIFVTDGAFDGIAETEITVNVIMHVVGALIEVPVTITNNVSTIAAEVSDVLLSAANTVIEDAYDGIDLYAARYAYEELSAAGKRAVDATALSAFEAKEAEYANDFAIISGPLDYSKTSYVAGTLVKEGFVEDADYGIVYEMQYSDQPGNGYVLIKLNENGAFASGKKVYISIFNGGEEDAYALYLKDKTSWVKTDIVLPAGEWTEVEIDSGLLSGDTIGLVATNAVGFSYKFTMMYSKSDAYIARQIDAIIDELPETLEGHEYGPVALAKRLYATLTEEGKVLVENWATVEALDAAYAEQYQSVLVMDEAAMFYQNVDAFGDIATWAYDTNNVYGNVIVGTGKASGAAVIKSNIALPDLGIAKTVYIWVYKNTAGRFNFRQNGNWNTMHNINANTWTLISFPASELKSFDLGFWDVNAGDTIMFSNIWAETYAPEIKDMEAQIAQLSADDADAIVAAFDVYNALPVAVQESVSNKDVLLGYVDVFNSTLIGRAINAIGLIPETLAGNQYGLILAAKDAYEKVPVALRDQVTNYSNLTAAESAWKNNYVLVAAAQEGALTEISANYGTGVHTISYDVVENYGKVVKIDVQTAGTLAFQYSVTSNMAGVKSVVFSVYNGSDTDRPLDTWNGGGATGTGTSMLAGVWNTVEILLDSNYKGITTSTTSGYTTYTGKFGVWGATPGTWYIASVYFTTYWADVANVQSMIDALVPGAQDAIFAARDAYDALPDDMKAYVNIARLEECEESLADYLVSNVENAIDAIPATLEAKDIIVIEDAREKYEALTDSNKALVSNISKLEAAEANYAKYFVLGASASSFVDKTNGWLMGGAVAEGHETDETYGVVYTQTVLKLTNQKLTTFDTTATAAIKNYAKAVIYIYNGGNNHAKFHQFNGAWTILDITLYAGQWTKVEFNTADFDKTNLFLGAGGITETGITFKFSSMWLYTDEYLSEGINGVKVQEAIAAINALPETIREYDKEKLDSIRASVEEIPESMRGQITNLSVLEAAEATYAKYYLSVAAVSSFVEKTADYIGGGVAQVATLYDDTYGTTFNLTYVKENSKNGVAMRFTENGTLADYGDFVIYIYNGGNTTANVYYVNAGGSWITGQELPAGQWSKVVLDGTDFYSGRVISVINGELNATYKFSAIYAYTDTYKAEVENAENINAAIAAIETLPETIYEYHYATIQSVKAIIDLVPEELRNQITNIADFEAFEAEYNKYYALAASASGYTDSTNGNVLGGATNFEIKDDAVYGSIAVATINADKKPPRLDIKLNNTKVFDYQEVAIYIYNGGDTVVSALQHTSATLASVVELPVGEWTKVVYNAQNFTSSMYIGVIGTINPGSVYKFSSAYGYTDAYYARLNQEKVDAVIAAIETLPEVIDIDAYDKLLEVRSIVESLPVELQGGITNIAKLEAAEDEFNSNYVMVRAWNTTDGVSDISGNYSAGTILTTSIVEDETYGKVLKLEQAGTGSVAIEYNALTTEIPEGWILRFVGYNGGSAAHPFDICEGGSFSGVGYGGNAPAGEWLTVEINAADCKFRSATTGRIGFWNATPGTYYIAKIYAINPEVLEGAAVQAAIDAIDAIPEDLEGYDYGYIAYAQDAVAALSDEGKAQVTNIADLEAAIVKYNQAYVAVLPMVESSAFVENANVGGYKANYTYEVDATYGRVLVGNVHTDGAAVVMTSVATPDLSLCEEVYVWVYKTTAGRLNVNQNDNWNTMINIPADEWTLVTIPASEYDNDSFGMWDAKAGDVIKYSTFWATSSSGAIDTAIAAIETLPETIKEYSLAKIQAVRAVVEEVPEAFRNATFITNLAKLEAAEAEYAEYYILLSDLTTYIDKTADMMGGGHAQTAIVDDATCGSAYAMTYVVENGKNGVMFKFANEGELESYEQFAIYIYNGGNTVAKVEYVNKGGSWVTGQELPVGEWTKVMFDATNIYAGKLIGIRDGELNATYKFSSIYAYTDAYGLLLAQEAIDNAEAVIANIPAELEGYEYNYILDAQNAIALVPAKYQSYISNYADYEAAVEYYNTYYIAVTTLENAADYYEKSSSFGILSDASIVDDATYGKVLVRSVHTAGAQVNYYDNFAALEGVASVSIYVKKQAAGSFCAHSGWSPMVSVKANTWTRIDIPVGQFNSSAFGVWNVAIGETVMYSMMWADKPAKLVEPIKALIEELPEGTNEFDYMAIEEARAAVNTLPEELRTSEYISNLYVLENAEATYASFYQLVANAATYQDITSGWIGGSNSYITVEDDDFGTLFSSTLATMNTDGRVAFKMHPSVSVTNYTAISVYIYNGGTADANLMILTGGSSWDAYDVLPAGEWTRVVIDTSKFGADPIMGLKNVTETDAEFLFSSAFGLTEYGQAITSINAANEAISNLPATIDAYSVYAINAARVAVDAVPVDYRTAEYIPQIATLEAIEAKYNESYVVVRTWENTNGLSNISANYSAGTTQAISVVEDPTYGKVLKIEHTGTGALALEYTALTTDMSSATKLIFVGYNGGSSAHPFDICQGGSFTGVGFGGNAPVGQWFTVEINAADYKFRSATTGRVGFWGATEGTYYIAAIIAESVQGIVNKAIDAIDAIPSNVIGETAGLIATARAAVDAVPEAYREQITNLSELVAAEAQFALDHVIIATPDSYVFNTNMGGSPANAQIVKDAEYGNVFKYTKVTTGGVFYNFTPLVNIPDYAKLFVAIRVSAAAYAGLKVNNAWNTEYAPLVAGEWTIVEVTAAELSANGVGVWGGVENMTIEISAVWAVKELPQDNVDQNDPF